jgi:hypothetical protein
MHNPNRSFLHLLTNGKPHKTERSIPPRSGKTNQSQKGNSKHLRYYPLEGNGNQEDQQTKTGLRKKSAATEGTTAVAGSRTTPTPTNEQRKWRQFRYDEFEQWRYEGISWVLAACTAVKDVEGIKLGA